MTGKIHILGLSDVEIGFIYSPMVATRFKDIDMIISCGDLPYYYLEYIVSMLDIPMYYVRGNHASTVEVTTAGDRTSPWGATDLNQRVIQDRSGILLAGLEGSLQYNLGPYQYTQNQYWLKVFQLVPMLMLNRLRFGRFLDIFVTHAPPWHIHDETDRPHQGIKAFRWLIRVFHPTYALHGHIHLYRNDAITQTRVDRTNVVNVFGFKELDIEAPVKRSREK